MDADGFNPPTAPRLASSPGDEASLGQLFGRLSEDFSVLIRQEVELAKAEIKQEATKAGKGAGFMGASGVAGHMGLLLASFAAAWGLAEAIPAGWAFLIIAIIYFVVAAVLYTNGRRELRTVHPVPEKTAQSLKEDAQWAKHPTS
ncbi:MAG TPA: phage holin family protein [Acidimicrobiales bacterium]|nr:phage holin family protein [Acidimicrobiales bacterium]